MVALRFLPPVYTCLIKKAAEKDNYSANTRVEDAYIIHPHWRPRRRPDSINHVPHKQCSKQHRERYNQHSHHYR